MTTFKTMFRATVLAGLTATLAIPAAFAAPEAIGRYKNWVVFRDNTGSDTICYAATEATDKAPQAADHGDVWFYVTSWKSGRARNQPSLKVGYDLREDIAGRASVGRSAWQLFTKGNEAFADDADDSALVRAVKRGSELRVEGTSARNTKVAYHFSLSGSSAAIDKAGALCR